MAVTLVTISGSVVDPEGVGIVRGTITCQLSTSGSTLDGAASVRVCGEASGAITAGVLSSLALVPNDAITPSGTYYLAIIEGNLSNGRRYRKAERWQLTSDDLTLDIGAVPRLDAIPGLSVGVSVAGGDLSAGVVTATGATGSRTVADHLATLPDSKITVTGFDGLTAEMPLADQFANMVTWGTSTSSLSFDGVSMRETRGLTWTANGTVPQLSSAGLQIPNVKGGAGPFSDANWYGPINGANSDPLDTSGNRWGIIVFTTTASSQVILSSGPYLSAAGWGLSIQPGFEFDSWVGAAVKATSGNACCYAGINVGAWCRVGTSISVKLNLGQVVTNASAGTEVAGTAYPIRLGRYESAGFPFTGAVVSMTQGLGLVPGTTFDAWATAQMRRFFPRCVVAFGDSITIGYGVTMPYPTTLAY